jgi:hypothetical protein
MYRKSAFNNLTQCCFKLILLVSLFVLFISITSVQAEPKLEIRQTLEKTSVITGEELNGIVYIKNSGGEPLKILGVSSSCGCTTLRLNKRLVEPEKEVELHFIVDTRGKLGLIEKTITIHTNTKDSPHTEIVHFHALASGMGGASTQSIFEPPCASCHLDSGIGKSGKDLYNSICGMCHPTVKFQFKNYQSLQIMTSKGNNKIGMPGFGDYFSAKQINSIIDFIIEKQGK